MKGDTTVEGCQGAHSSSSAHAEQKTAKHTRSTLSTSPMPWRRSSPFFYPFDRRPASADTPCLVLRGRKEDENGEQRKYARAIRRSDDYRQEALPQADGPGH